MSNFEKVLEFNKAFGVKTNNKPCLDIFEKDEQLVKYRLSLIDEEVSELHEAIKNEDFVETIDALTDILYVVYGAFTAFGVNADKAFEIVQHSNMSKLCENEKDAIETVERYYNEIPMRYDSPMYRKAKDDKHWIVYNESTNKILKNYKYIAADFNNLIKENQS